MGEDPDITPEQKVRLDQLKVLLGGPESGLTIEQLAQQIRDRHPEVDLMVLRDASITWAFLSTARSHVDASISMMPPTLAELLGLRHILGALDGAMLSMQTMLTQFEPKGDEDQKEGT